MDELHVLSINMTLPINNKDTQKSCSPILSLSILPYILYFFSMLLALFYNIYIYIYIYIYI